MIFTKTLSLAAAFGALAAALPSPVVGQSGSSGYAATTPTSSASGTTATGGAGNGGVTIVNHLNTTLYLWSVSNTQGPMQTLPQGGSYSEKWRVNPNGGGVSIKMATSPSQADVLQYEYTVSDPQIYWDLSCINMGTNSEFTKYGFGVTNNGGSSCPAASCAPGDTACADAYLYPSDNQATHGCPISTDFTLTIGE